MQDASMQEVVAHLRESLRLSEVDAAVFVRLSVGGPAKVSDLADGLGVHRNEVYRAIERLQARGFATPTQDTPVRYVTATAAEAFDAEIEAQLLAIGSLRRSREEITRIVSQLHSVAEPPANTYRVIQGAADIGAARDRCIAEAGESIAIAASHPGMVEALDRTGGLALLVERARAGVRVRLLVSPALGTRDRLRALAAEPTVEVREFEASGPLRFLVMDGREVLLWAMDGGQQGLDGAEVAVLARATGLVDTQLLFFEQAWALAPPLA